ncbi:MAG TPA: type II secretion system F family protein [Mycobacteriales bacterium]|nr:type II secretion system F family protein [Mycobacteriales bacterium]
MTSVALVLLAAAVLVLWRPQVGPERLVALFGGGGPDVRTRPWFRVPGRWAAGGLGLLAGVVGLAGGLGAAPALSAVAVVTVGVGMVMSSAARRRDGFEGSSVVEAVAVLAAELRAGQSQDRALAAAAQAVRGGPAAVLDAAAAVGRLGGSAAAVLRAADGCAQPAAGLLRRVAAGWQLSESAGASLSTVLDQAERAARDRQRHDHQLAALLAGPRATAVLLAALPVVGLALGVAMGAHPLAVLLGTAAGQGALVAGVLLEMAGLAWTERIVRSAGVAR